MTTALPAMFESIVMMFGAGSFLYLGAVRIFGSALDVQFAAIPVLLQDAKQGRTATRTREQERFQLATLRAADA
jgi:hypothetical protein